MGRINRGNTSKLSIRLSREARDVHEDGTITGNIVTAAENLGISAAGVILFELTKLIENPPSLAEVKQMEQEITLSEKHFVLTLNLTMQKKINDLAVKYGMKKNILIGYIVSDHFRKLNPGPKNPDQIETKKVMIVVNKSLKKKMNDFCEDNFLPLNAVVGYSILNGPFEALPEYYERETSFISTNIPSYMIDIVKEGADSLNIREHFFTSLCVYKQFMTPKGRFYKKE